MVCNEECLVSAGVKSSCVKICPYPCLELKQAEAAPQNVDGEEADKAAMNPRRAVLEACMRQQPRHDQEEYRTCH